MLSRTPRPSEERPRPKNGDEEELRARSLSFPDGHVSLWRKEGGLLSLSLSAPVVLSCRAVRRKQHIGSLEDGRKEVRKEIGAAGVVRSGEGGIHGRVGSGSLKVRLMRRKGSLRPKNVSLLWRGIWMGEGAGHDEVGGGARDRRGQGGEGSTCWRAFSFWLVHS